MNGCSREACEARSSWSPEIEQRMTAGDEVITAECDMDRDNYIRETIFNFDGHRRIEHYASLASSPAPYRRPKNSRNRSPFSGDFSDSMVAIGLKECRIAVFSVAGRESKYVDLAARFADRRTNAPGDGIAPRPPRTGGNEAHPED